MKYTILYYCNVGGKLERRSHSFPNIRKVSEYIGAKYEEVRLAIHKYKPIYSEYFKTKIYIVENKTGE